MAEKKNTQVHEGKKLAALEARVEGLNEQLEEANKQLEESRKAASDSKADYLRLLAEFDTFRRRQKRSWRW